MKFYLEEEEINIMELVLTEYINKNNSVRLKQKYVKKAEELLKNIEFYKKQIKNS